MRHPRKLALKSQNHKTGQRDAPPAASLQAFICDEAKFLLRLHMKPGGKQWAGLVVETGAGFGWDDEGLVLIGQELEKMDGWMTGRSLK